MRLIDKLLCFLVGHKWEYTDLPMKTIGQCMHCGKVVTWWKNIKDNK